MDCGFLAAVESLMEVLGRSHSFLHGQNSNDHSAAKTHTTAKGFSLNNKGVFSA